jgi:hypothetical protein
MATETLDDFNEFSEWENELDMLGTNSETDEYIRMLEKAPGQSRSLATLENFIQARCS